MKDAQQLYQYVLTLLEKYEQLGFLPGIALPFIESFLPFLPLIVFVLANGAAYGLVKGFLLSWMGTCIGMIVVFLLIRKFGSKPFFLKIKADRRVEKITTWVDRNGFTPLFFLLCFPFSPSSIINIVAGLSKVSVQQFVLAVLFGKAVMIFSITYIGTSIIEFARHPIKTIIIICCISLFWMFGSYLEKKLLHKQENE